MNPAIWKKAVSDAWLHLAICSAILILFAWVFVWLMSQIDLRFLEIMLKMLPPFMKKMIGFEVDELATTLGRLSVLYIHVITMLVCVGWALGRGSDSVSGEIGRGTMDLILSLPVRRVTVIIAPGVVASLGAVVLAGSVLAGTTLGLLTVDLPGNVSPWQLLPGAVNLSCMTFCLTGATMFISSFNRDRWRTIALSGGFFVVSFIIEMVWRLWPGGDWLKYFTFLSAFQPQRLILKKEIGSLAWQCNAVLLGLGLIAYLAAAIVLSRRDIPAAR